MMMKTLSGVDVDSSLISHYFNSLIGMYFKIIPLYENREKSLGAYVVNLRDELEGCGNIIEAINGDPMYMTLLATLQFISDNLDDDSFTLRVLRQKVFGAISVCKKLACKYGAEVTE